MDAQAEVQAASQAASQCTSQCTSLGPLPAYRALVAAGGLAPDPAQALAAERLQALWARLRGYQPVAHAAVRHASRPALGRVWGSWRGKGVEDDIPDSYPHGLYLVGSVGRGKSMLMDLFYASVGTSVGQVRKRRVHFHAFMQDVHGRIHAWRREPHRLADPHSDDPIPPLADVLASEAVLLCFDEFQINDIVDAMILGRLFKALFARGVVVVATSNTAPADLFAGQPGRDAFLPFIALLQQYLDLIVMDGGRDFRRQRRQRDTWHVPADDAARAALDRAFGELTEGAGPRPETLTVMGRSLHVPRAANGIARIDFDALCRRPLGAGDYLALATHYEAVVIDDIPRLSPENFDEARRFITLIDALYEHRVKLVASAAAGPDELFEAGRGAEAFRRTASRLHEMGSAAYAGLPHLT